MFAADGSASKEDEFLIAALAIEREWPPLDPGAMAAVVCNKN